MFGKNKLTKPEYGDGETLKVIDVWPTIQGEGPFAGQAAIFVRLAGCNLACWFCDTDFESNAKVLPTSEIVEKINELQKRTKTNLVVITGGEPLAQQIIPLCWGLLQAGISVQVETAGTVVPPTWEGLSLIGLTPLSMPFGATCVTIVCSPKTAVVKEAIQQCCGHWKYIIREGDVDNLDGLPMRDTQGGGIRNVRLCRPKEIAGKLPTIWVQPMDEYNKDGSRNEAAYEANVRVVAEIVQHFGYRASIQLHKILNVA